MGKLVLHLANGTLLHVPLDKGRITIGRRADNDVCLPYPAVSGEHAAVVTILADSFLEDLGSTNGTLVNGRAAGTHFLNDRDQIDIGRQRLIYLADNDAQVDPLPADLVRNQLRGLTERVDSVRGDPPVPMPIVNTGRTTYANPGILLGDEFEREMVEPARIVAAPARAVPPAGERRQPDAVAAVEQPGGTAVADPIRGATGARLAPAAPARAPTPPRAPFTADPPARRGDPNGPQPDLASTQRFTIPVQPPPPPPVAPPAAAAAPDAPVVRMPSVRVLSGPSTGRSVPLPNDQLSVGRIGVQVAVVRKAADGYRLIPVEGDQPPRINGAPVPAEGSPLHPGDTFEVAGVRLELVGGS